MKFIAKLPKSYYRYLDVDLSKLSKKGNDVNITLNLSTFISCKLEQYAVNEGLPTQDILKKILIDEGIIEKDELKLSERGKNSSKFFGLNCEDFKGIGTSKLFRIYMSEFARAKIIKKLIDEGCDLSFFIKKALVKKESKKKYHLIDLHEIDE